MTSGTGRDGWSDTLLYQAPGDLLEGLVMGASAGYFGYLNAQAVGALAANPVTGNLILVLRYPELAVAVYSTSVVEQIVVKAVVPVFRFLVGS